MYVCDSIIAKGNCCVKSKHVYVVHFILQRVNTIVANRLTKEHITRGQTRGGPGIFYLFTHFSLSTMYV